LCFIQNTKPPTLKNTLRKTLLYIKLISNRLTLPHQSSLWHSKCFITCTALNRINENKIKRFANCNEYSIEELMYNCNIPPYPNIVHAVIKASPFFARRTRKLISCKTIFHAKKHSSALIHFQRLIMFICPLTQRFAFCNNPLCNVISSVLGSVELKK